MNTYVIIPTYNEAKTIGWLINKIKGLLINNIIVVDDGSVDGTYEIAQQSGATVLRNAKNLGKGKSLKIGFDYCLSASCDAIITMDGDGQHDPEEIPCLIECANKLNADVLVGNRMHKPQDMPFMRLITNKFMSAIISFIIHVNIPDTQCGFRLIKKSVLENLNLESSNFEIESEILIQAARGGFIIESIPVKTIYSADIASQINPFLDTCRFIKFILKTIWK